MPLFVFFSDVDAKVKLSIERGRVQPYWVLTCSTDSANFKLSYRAVNSVTVLLLDVSVGYPGLWINKDEPFFSDRAGVIVDVKRDPLRVLLTMTKPGCVNGEYKCEDGTGSYRDSIYTDGITYLTDLKLILQIMIKIMIMIFDLLTPFSVLCG